MTDDQKEDLKYIAFVLRNRAIVDDPLTKLELHELAQMLDAVRCGQGAITPFIEKKTPC